MTFAQHVDLHMNMYATSVWNVLCNYLEDSQFAFLCSTLVPVSENLSVNLLPIYFIFLKRSIDDQVVEMKKSFTNLTKEIPNILPEDEDENTRYD